VCALVNLVTKGRSSNILNALSLDPSCHVDLRKWNNKVKKKNKCKNLERVMKPSFEKFNFCFVFVLNACLNEWESMIYICFECIYECMRFFFLFWICWMHGNFWLYFWMHENFLFCFECIMLWVHKNFKFLLLFRMHVPMHENLFFFVCFCFEWMYEYMIIFYLLWMHVWMHENFEFFQFLIWMHVWMHGNFWIDFFFQCNLIHLCRD